MKINIDVSKWGRGVYMYRVLNTSTNEAIVNKFVKL